MKKCFVISPIGAEGTPVREHANDVFDYIIKPAMEQCGVTAYRSDHLHEPGRISDQMFRAILQDDLSVALLTGFNPNVFYELAVAQCAARPVVILMEKGHTLPFDIKDLRCVYYDLKPRSLFEQVYVKELVGHVRNIEAGGWKGVSPVSGLDLTGGESAAGPMRCYNRSMDYGNSEVWLKVLKATERVFDIMGRALSSWKHGKGFGELLVSKAKGGCQVRVLLAHPDNQAVREMINPHIPEETFATTVRKMGEMMEYFTALAQVSPNIQVRQMRSGYVHSHLTRSDQTAVVIPYLYSESSRYSPLYQYASGSQIYATMAQEFESLWKRSGDEEPPPA